ncbi:MAG: hypothetical protein HY873_00065 [Chloroflexi bacterium]|nr:hypothetical protein [Chloroflexota bacterium]
MLLPACDWSESKMWDGPSETTIESLDSPHEIEAAGGTTGCADSPIESILHERDLPLALKETKGEVADVFLGAEKFEDGDLEPPNVTETGHTLDGLKLWQWKPLALGQGYAYLVSGQDGSNPVVYAISRCGER